MAYGNIYRGGFSSKSIAGYVYIDKLDYTGSVTDVIIAEGSVNIKYSFRGWNNPIIGLTASLEIVNNGADFFDLIPLLEAEEREYRIRIERTSPSSKSLFTGFINCETNEIAYLKNRPIRINASSYLSKLQYVKPDLLETLEYRTFIDIILSCLELTGSEDPVRVNCKLYQSGMNMTSGMSLFNKSGVFTEIFWKNNVDRDNALEIITKILTPFDCYIYHYSGSWYIERYEDIWNGTQDYIIYSIGSTYDPTEPGTTEQTSDSSTDFSSLNLVGQSQVIGYIAGLQKLEVSLVQKLLFNMVLNDFTDATAISGTNPYPNYRTWQLWTAGSLSWYDKGLPFRFISNAVKRFYNIAGDYFPGIFTRFKVTVADDVSLTVKFKWCTWKDGAMGGWTGNWSDYKFYFHWYLRDTPGNYFIWNDAGTWRRSESGDQDLYLQEIEISGTSFDDANIGTEVSFSVPLGDVVGLPDGVRDLVLCIGTVKIWKSGTGYYPEVGSALGDVQVTASGSNENNLIEATINSNFLDKKEIKLDMYDAQNENIKNGIFWANYDPISARTSSWTSDGSLFETLAKRLIRNKFRLYRRARQKKTSQVKTSQVFKPLAMFTDSNEAGRKYLLTGYSYRPDKDLYDIELSEYDNSETINFL